MSQFNKPWKWLSDDYLQDGLGDFVLEAGDDGKPYGLHNGQIHHHYDETVKESHKQLIAAAPDLLEAAEEVLRLVDPANDAGQQPLRQLADAVRRAKGV